MLNFTLAVAVWLLTYGDKSTSFQVGDIFRECAACPEMVVLPKGIFMMGSPDLEWNRDKDEGPQHQVNIDYTLAVGRYEVTVAEFNAFVSSSSYEFDDDCIVWTGRGYSKRNGNNWQSPGFSQGLQQPVVCVNWNDAKAYVNWLSNKTSQEYRLLSEAEWEYAARAGTESQYYTGETIAPDQANYNADFKYIFADAGKGPFREKTVTVGSFPPNAYGLYEMSGNVMEWIEDCYYPSYIGASGNGNARSVAEKDCKQHVLRGGAWDFKPEGLRSANRHSHITESRYSSNGLRVARVVR